jgi:hypothetical protein
MGSTGASRGAIRLAQEKWVTVLGRCGKRRQDEEKNRLAGGNWTKRAKGI